MTVMYTLKKNCDNPLEMLKSILDNYAATQSEISILENFYKATYAINEVLHKKHFFSCFSHLLSRIII